MNKYIRYFMFVAAFGLCFASTNAFAQSANGVMMVVKGDIKIITSAGKTEKAKVGSKVFPGDAIESGPDSRAKVVMSDKNTININPDTKIKIDKYVFDPANDKKEVELNVMYGKVRASVEQKYDGEKNKFHVKTPSAVAGVRGTDFITQFNPQTNSAKIITFSGMVAVGSPAPGGRIANPVFVAPGQMTEAAAGAPPVAPKAVPKEELASANSESNAETAKGGANEPAPAADSEKKEEKKEEKADEAAADEPAAEDKKEEAKEEKKEETKEEKKAEEKKEEVKEEKKAEEKKEAAKEEKQAEKKEDKPAEKKEAVADKKDSPKDQAKSGDRAPASSNSMIGASDLASNVDMRSSANFAPPPVAPVIPVMPPPSATFRPPPTNTDLINNIVNKSGKANVNVIINIPQ